MEFSQLNCTKWLRTDYGNQTINPSDISQLINKRNVPAIVFVALMIFVGLVGNVLVIVIFKLKYSKSTYRVFVLCLAFLDTINCSLTMPFVLTYLLFSQNFPDEGLCKFGHFVGFYIGLASPFTLILIAFDRYRNICQPLCLQISDKKAKLYCVLVNVVSLALSWHVPVIYGNAQYDIVDINLRVTRCYKEDFEIAKIITEWQYVILTVILVLVSALLATLYFIIMLRVHKKSRYFTKVISTVSNASESDNTTHKPPVERGCSTSSYASTGSAVSFATKTVQTRKTTLTFLIITSVYIFSSFVHHALAIILHTVPDLDCKMTFTEGAIFWTFFWTIFINNIANPFIYGLSDERFRRHFRNFFKKQRRTLPTTLASKRVFR